MILDYSGENSALCGSKNIDEDAAKLTVDYDSCRQEWSQRGIWMSLLAGHRSMLASEKLILCNDNTTTAGSSTILV
jgi:hypothetical protein